MTAIIDHGDLGIFMFSEVSLTLHGSFNGSHFNSDFNYLTLKMLMEMERFFPYSRSLAKHRH